MAVDLYTLSRKHITVNVSRRGPSHVHYLEPAVSKAFSQDSQALVDCAIQRAHQEWKSCPTLPELVVRMEEQRIPMPGDPVLRWTSYRRVYLFDIEVLETVGYLGENRSGSYAFRTVEEQQFLNDLETARRIDEGTADVYRDFWAGVRFQTGSEFLAFRRGYVGPHTAVRNRFADTRPAPCARLSKILSLIKCIEFKGSDASAADIHYLGCLREKAAQLGYSFK